MPLPTLLMLPSRAPCLCAAVVATIGVRPMMPSVCALHACLCRYPGSYCPLGSTTNTQVQCPKGFFCPASSGTPTACQPGSSLTPVQHVRCSMRSRTVSYRACVLFDSQALSAPLSVPRIRFARDPVLSVSVHVSCHSPTSNQRQRSTKTARLLTFVSCRVLLPAQFHGGVLADVPRGNLL